MPVLEKITHKLLLKPSRTLLDEAQRVLSGRQLEQVFDQLGRRYGVSGEFLHQLHDYLKPLKKHHKPTYEHSLRVAIYAADLTNELGGDPATEFAAGALHDLGKLKINPELLDKTTPFSRADMRVMRHHPDEGAAMIANDLPDLATVVAAHHCFQHGREYGHKGHSKIRQQLARELSIADFFDAAAMRQNAHEFGRKADFMKHVESNYPGKRRSVLKRLRGCFKLYLT